jgi:uncharacterized membrane protein YukC
MPSLACRQRWHVARPAFGIMEVAGIATIILSVVLIIYVVFALLTH